MKRIPVLFLQAVIVFIGVLVLAVLVCAPLTEGRATNLDLFTIYSDPFILYGYAISIAFFVALYQLFKLLGYIGRRHVFSPGAVKTLKAIKLCAIILSASIVAGGLYIMGFHHKADDPAGFIMVCAVTAFAAIVAATAAAIGERILQNAVDMKVENDLTI